MGRKTTARIQIIAAAVLFSTGGAAIKQCSFTSWQVAGFRSILAALLILVALPLARRGWSIRGALVGSCFGATLVLFVLANKATTAANAIFLQDTAPLYVLLLGPLLLKEPIHRRDLLFMAAVVVGLALFFLGVSPATKIATNPFTGNVLAVISGITWALTIVGLRWLGRGKGESGAAVSAVVIGNLMAFGACLYHSMPIENHSIADWAVVTYLGVFQIGVAYILLTRGIAHVSALEATTLLLIEPVVSPFWAFLLHGEAPGTLALGGGILILGSTTLKTWVDARRPGH